MNKYEKEDLNASLSILQRLDRLESLMLLLEEKQCYIATDCGVAIQKCLKPMEKWKTLSLSSALEEVHHKGTLMERLALLENRLYQLSMKIMEFENTSRWSNSSTSAVAEKQENGSDLQDMNMITILQDNHLATPLIKHDSIIVEACSSNSELSCKGQRTQNKTLMSKVEYSNRKWLKWFKLGC